LAVDSAARAALAALVRGEVRTELAAELEQLAALAGRVERENRSALVERVDWVAAEVDEVRHRLALVEQRVGLATSKPRGAHRRRLAVIELRRQGHSLRAISVLLNLARGTVESDLRRVRVSLPPDAVGVDGKPIGRRAMNGRAA
jgi:hypothetical protein